LLFEAVSKSQQGLARIDMPFLCKEERLIETACQIWFQRINLGGVEGFEVTGAASKAV